MNIQEFLNQLPEEKRQEVQLLINNFLADNVITDKERSILHQTIAESGIDSQDIDEFIDELVKRWEGLNSLSDVFLSNNGDNVITEKERQLLLNKAKELGIDTASFNSFIDKKIQAVNNPIEGGVEARTANRPEKKHRGRKLWKIFWRTVGIVLGLFLLLLLVGVICYVSCDRNSYDSSSYDNGSYTDNSSVVENSDSNSDYDFTFSLDELEYYINYADENEDYETLANYCALALENDCEDPELFRIYRGQALYYDMDSEESYYDAVYYLNQILPSLTSDNDKQYIYSLIGKAKYWHGDDDYESFLNRGGQYGIDFIQSLALNENSESLQKYDGYMSEGTGFLIDSTGYLATNHHVIYDEDNSRIWRTIHVWRNESGEMVKYSAAPVIVSPENDLAILKINGKFHSESIPYLLAVTEQAKGSDVFTVGYPDIWVLGDEQKLTKGIISSQTGIYGDTRNYQMDAAVNGGNSGGPLFDDKNGNLIGINSATARDKMDVCYAIKSTVLLELIEENLPDLHLPTHNSISDLSRDEKCQAIEPFVFLITVR